MRALPARSSEEQIYSELSRSNRTGVKVWECPSCNYSLVTALLFDGVDCVKREIFHSGEGSPRDFHEPLSNFLHLSPPFFYSSGASLPTTVAYFSLTASHAIRRILRETCSPTSHSFGVPLFTREIRRANCFLDVRTLQNTPNLSCWQMIGGANIYEMDCEIKNVAGVLLIHPTPQNTL